jgi:hypothetical protein
VFVLGVAIIIEALTAQYTPIAELVIGMIMVGVLPLDDFIEFMTVRHKAKDKIEKEEE